MLKKREGTSGIRGHLYETKLLSLLLCRARHNDDIEEFHLASNVDKIGAFDDICFRAKLKDFDRPISVFIQLKHRENNKALTLDNKTDLRKYFESYLKIRRTFSEQDDALFKGHFDETECIFVWYTNTTNNQNKKMLHDKFGFLNDLIGTDDYGGFHPSYNNEHVEFLCKVAVKEEITLLAVTVAKFIKKADFGRILSDELVRRYHVILAQRIMLISDIQPEGHRDATFRNDFFTSNAEFITTFKNTLFMEVLKNRKVDEETIISYLSNTKEAASPENLSKLIGSVINYKYDKLEFINKETADDLKQQLYKVNVSKSTVDFAINAAAKKILSSMCFKVPSAFGNQDLTIGGNDIKIEKKLDDLASQIYDLLLKSQPYSKVTIDDSLAKQFLKLNGGIAGAVGNILVPDANSQLMKFTDDIDSLGHLASRLFKKLKVKIQDLQKYRFEVKNNNFPKLSFQYSAHDKNMAEDYLNKLIFYTNQADENNVEFILKNEIEDLQYNKGNNINRITVDAIFLTYHNDIQKWWVSSTKEYLTKYTDFFDKAILNIIDEPLVSHMNIVCRNKIQHIDYTFKEDALLSIKFDVPILNTIIITDTILLTVAKILPTLKNKDHIVLDLEYFLNLPNNDCNQLCNALSKTTKNKILIFVCENVQRNQKIFQKITKAVHEKMKIIVTNRASVEIIKKHLPQTVDLVNDVKNNLTYMSKETIKTLLKKCTVDFQDENISLDLIIDDESMAFVEGDILNRIVCEDIFGKLGKSLKMSNYEDMKHLYVNRHIIHGGKLFNGTAPERDVKLIETLNDIADDVVLITANPGMGKSTLLTHISLETKRLDPSMWIVRINLIEYSKEFKKWQDNKTNIDSETLKFLCHAIVTEKHENAHKLDIELEESNGTVSLKKCTGDQWTTFELKLFLHFYNKRRIIFIFDGFDEICPDYLKEVMIFLKAVRSSSQKHKMWIASRSYNDIKSNLEREFGISYEILILTPTEWTIYLKKFWKHNLILKEFDDKQIENVYNFYEYIEELLVVIGLKESPLLHVYMNAMRYLMKEYPKSLDYTNRSMEGLIAGAGLLRYNKKLFDKSTDFKTDNDIFVGTPLNLYLLADYFQNEIKDTTKKTNKWNMEINTFTMYKRFLETKLDKIRFQEKNKMDTSYSDIKRIFNKEKADFILMHKKVAAYVIFHRSIHKLFNREELEEIKSIIKSMKKNWEKTGLIYSVTSDDIPIFVHRSFAEYFAVVYFCDQLKIEKCNEKQETMMEFLFNTMFLESSANVRIILHTVLKIDDSLMNILQRNGKVIFDLLMEQTKAYLAVKKTDELQETKHALILALRNNLNEFVQLFSSILKTHLQENDVNNFIKLIKQNSMFGTAFSMKCEEFITSALDIVRKVDPSKFNDLFKSPTFSICENLCLRNNEEILEMCRHKENFPYFRDVEYYTYDTDRDKYVCLLTHTFDKVRYPGINHDPHRYYCKKEGSKYVVRANPF